MNYPQGYLFCWIDCQNSSHSTLTYPSDILGYYFTQYQSISASFRDELPSGLLFCWTGRNTGYSNRSKGASLTVSLAWSPASWDPCPVPCQLGPLPTVSDRKASLCWKNHHHIWGLLAISGTPAVHLKLGFWWHMMHLYSYTVHFIQVMRALDPGIWLGVLFELFGNHRGYHGHSFIPSRVYNL